MEYFDIYTADGRRTGRIAPKGTQCVGADYYLGVHMYVYNSQGQFLLQKRALTKSDMPGVWEIHMGHVMAGESAREAARRELGEEIGLDVPEDDMLHVARFVWRRYNHLIDVFFCRAEAETDRLILQEEEVADVKWIDGEEMKRFVASMKDRPEEYRRSVGHYIETAICP